VLTHWCNTTHRLAGWGFEAGPGDSEGEGDVRVDVIMGTQLLYPQQCKGKKQVSS